MKGFGNLWEQPRLDEYNVEALGNDDAILPGCWRFLSRIQGLERAIEWAAACRLITGDPTRVTRAQRGVI